MKHRTKNTLRAIADYLGLKVKFVSYFGPDVHGKLLPREKRILINAYKPRYEHVFTLLHEIGHFLLHSKNRLRLRYPWFLEIIWRNESVMKLCSKLRRHVRYAANRESRKEWEADAWSFCMLVYLVRRNIGRSELIGFLNAHPEKLRLFFLAVTVNIYCDIKARVKQLI
jgi:hypothetical protein